MRKPWSRLPLRLLTLAFASSPGWVLGAPPARAFVLDSGSPTLVALELPSGKRAGSVALQGHPEVLLQSPDGTRLVVLDRGPGEDKNERGYKATGKSTATIVDPASLAVVGRVELGSGVLAGGAFTPDGRRLAVVCPGYEAKNPAESQPRELVVVDLASGKEAGRLALEPGAFPAGASRDGRSLALVQGLPRTEKFPYPRSRVVIVDLEGPSIRASLDAGGWTALRADGAQLYLLDAGKPDKDPQKNRNGTLQVVSLERGVLAATLDAGRKPGEFYLDEAGGQLFVASEGPAGGTEGELRAVRGEALAATLKTAAKPKLVARAGESLYVVGEKAVTLVDPAALQVSATLPLARGADALVDDDDEPTELKVSGDGKRAFVHYGLHHKVATLDLEQKTAVGSTKTGRGGKKFLGNMMAGLYGAPGMLAAGYSMWIYTQPRMLAVRPDGRFAYAVNNQTKDITVVDGTTGKSAEMIGGNGYALELLKDGRFLYEVSGSELRLVDLEKNVKAAELPLDDLRGLFFPKDRSVAVALAKQTVLVLDGATGKELARLTDLVSPDAIVFDEASGPAEARVQP